jgi:hypothetical protein
MVKRTLFPALVLATFVLAGCANHTGALTDTVTKFNNALRWKGYSAAATLVTNEYRQKFMSDRVSRWQQSNMVDCAVLDLSFNEKKDEAQVVVLYSLYNDSDGLLISSQEMQTWKYRGSGWLLADSKESQEPVTGTPSDF